MSASSDDDIAVDNPSSEEISHEVLEAAGKYPSSEETSQSVSGAMCSEIPSVVSTAKADSQSSEDITSQPSVATRNSPPPPPIDESCLPHVLEELENCDLTLEQMQYLLNYIELTLEQRASLLRRINNLLGIEVVDDCNEKAPEEPPAVVDASPSNEEEPIQIEQPIVVVREAPKPITPLRRLWIQRDPWIAHHKKYRCSFIIAHFVGIIGLFFLFLRFAPLPELYQCCFPYTGASILVIRCICMHFILPEGPPYLAKQNGDPIYQAEKLKRSKK